VNPVRDAVFGRELMAGAKEARLDKLIGGYRKRAHDEIISAEVLELAVQVAEDFRMQRRGAHNLAVHLDVGTRRSRFN
jgi:hypothetical protein